MPTLVIETPKRRKSERSKYPELEAFGYVGRNNRLGAEIATDEDWAWWEEKAKGGKEGGSGSGRRIGRGVIATGVVQQREAILYLCGEYLT